MAHLFKFVRSLCASSAALHGCVCDRRVNENRLYREEKKIADLFVESSGVMNEVGLKYES